VSICVQFCTCICTFIFCTRRLGHKNPFLRRSLKASCSEWPSCHPTSRDQATKHTRNITAKWQQQTNRPPHRTDRFTILVLGEALRVVQGFHEHRWQLQFFLGTFILLFPASAFTVRILRQHNTTIRTSCYSTGRHRPHHCSSQWIRLAVKYWQSVFIPQQMALK